MTAQQLQFARFKASQLGRTIDITLGIVLLWWGFGFTSLAKDIVALVGVFVLLAGVLNVCWLAPILGIPFRGSDVPPPTKPSKT